MKLTIDFAFAGFDIIKKNPVAVLLWGLVYLVVSVVATGIIAVMAGPALVSMQAYEQSPPTDPSEVFVALGTLIPAILIAVVISLVVSAIIQCAVYRSRLQPSAKGFGYMQLGGQEWLMVIANILLALAFIVFYVMFVVCVAIPMVIASLVVQANGVLGGILIFCIGVAAIVALLYILSRWSLALVQSYAEKKINIFGSFKLTKGNGWTLLGGYILLCLVGLIAMIIMYVLVIVIAMILGASFTDAARQIMEPDMTSLAALMSVAFGVQLVLSSLFTGVFYALIYGASVSAYQTLTVKDTNAANVI